MPCMFKWPWNEPSAEVYLKRHLIYSTREPIHEMHPDISSNYKPKVSAPFIVTKAIFNLFYPLWKVLVYVVGTGIAFQKSYCHVKCVIWINVCKLIKQYIFWSNLEGDWLLRRSTARKWTDSLYVQAAVTTNYSFILKLRDLQHSHVICTVITFRWGGTQESWRVVLFNHVNIVKECTLTQNIIFS